MGLSQSLNIKQDMKMSLSQKIELSQIIVINPNIMDILLNSLESNFKIAEEVLNPFENNSSDTAIKGILCNLYQNKSKASSGFVMESSIKGLSLEKVLEDSHIAIKPDVTFTQRPNIHESPIITPNKIILPREITITAGMEIIPKEFKKTRKLYQTLVRYREWMNQKAREGYEALGSEQRKFINTLNPIEKAVYSMDDLGKKINLNYSTIYRMFLNRFIAVGNQEETSEAILPSKILFCNQRDFITIQNLSKLKGYFEQEARIGEGLTDNNIAAKTGLVRRTVTNYRSQIGIPNASKRTIEYLETPGQVYKIPM